MAQDSLLLAPPAVRVDDVSAARKAAVVAAGLLVGLAVAVLWSARLVDDQIGESVASGVLGQDAQHATLDSGVTGAVFAFVVGFAGTFTACNVAAFSAIGPMVAAGGRPGSRVRSALPQIGWLSVGVIVVAGLYGAIGATIGDGLPQLTTATIGNNMPIRTVQSLVVFTIIGLTFLWLGLGAIGVVPDAFGRLSARWRHAPSLLMGGLIGGFLIGRPYPLFFKLFQQAAHDHNAAFGAASFVLTALGNIAVMVILFLLLTVTVGPGLQRWLAARPGRLATVTATALIVGGSFMIFYWGVRLPAKFDYGWFPVMPWG